ncbi:MAG: hypothetical protein ABSG25_04140 [Bryobacteraceae bacterium]
MITEIEKLESRLKERISFYRQKIKETPKIKVYDIRYYQKTIDDFENTLTHLHNKKIGKMDVLGTGGKYV